MANGQMLHIFERQRQTGFRDLAESEVTATIHLSERLVNELVADLLPTEGKVREIQVRIEDGNRLIATVRLSGPSFLPAVPVTLDIDEQPQLPERAVLGTRISLPSGLMFMATSILPSLVKLPTGISLDGERIRIDIRRLLAQRQMESWLEFVTDLRVTTRAGAVVVNFRSTVPSGVRLSPDLARL